MTPWLRAKLWNLSDMNSHSYYTVYTVWGINLFLI